MEIVILLAVIGLSVAVPTPGFLFKNLYKPVIEDQKTLKPRIIGGSEAVPHSRPYQAFLEVYDEAGGAWYCGGEVISKNFLLTAAHCAGDGGLYSLITLGAHDVFNTNEPTQLQVWSSYLLVHPDYDANSIRNDIAAFGFDQPIELNENIQPVALPSRGDAANTFVGENATVSGWGYTVSGGGADLSPVLKVLTTPIAPNSECANVTHWDIPDTQICISGALETGACNGDSGGPLTVNIDGVDTVVGIVSYGVRNCLPGYPTVFTRVTSFLDWIEDHTF